MASMIRAFVRTTCLWIWLIHYVSTQTITQGPENVGSNNGEPSIMECRISDMTSSAMEWIFFPNGTATNRRVYYYDATSGTEDKPFPGEFDVDASGFDQGIYDLVILDTAPGMAGDYQCRIIQPLAEERANFVSVGDMSCTPGPGEREVVVGEFVFMDCSVSYTGYKAPYLIWEGNSNIYDGERMSDYEQSRLVSNVTAEAMHHLMEFRCDLSFVTEDGDSKPAPTYNDSCTTYFSVLHGATSIIITPDPGDIVTINVGEYVNCTASGNPVPVMMWEDVDGGAQYMGGALLIMPEWQNMMKIFTCIATNTIDGNEHFARLNISLNVMEDPDSPVTTTGGVETWVIVVAVVVPVVVLVAVGVAVYFILKNKKKKKKQKAAEAVISQGPQGPGPVMHFTNINQPPPRGAPPPRGYHPPGPNNRDSNGRTSTMMAGVPVAVPPGAESEQQSRSGKDSPGYGDLGIKQFGSTSNGLDSSVEFDPDPTAVAMNPKGSRGNLYGQGPRSARGSRGSQGSLLSPEPGASYPERYANVPGNYPPEGNPQAPPATKASINRAPMSRGQMGSQGSLSHVVPARGNLGSQGSLSQVQAARGYMGSQGSIHQLQAAQGYMGSQRSLASQASREYGQVPLQIHEIPDTTV